MKLKVKETQMQFPSILRERTLNDDEIKMACVYACYERAYCHLFNEYYSFNNFPALFCDRFTGWTYSKRHEQDPEIRNEPFLALNDGFKEFIDEYVRTTKIVKKSDFVKEMILNFQSGNKISVPLIWVHGDGANYMTFIVLEGLDESGKNLVYTKLSSSERVINKQMPVEKVEDLLLPDEDGNVFFEIIKPAEIINKLNEMSFKDQVKYIFNDLYAMEIKNKEVYKNGERVKLTQSGYTDFINYLKNNEKTVLSDDTMPKTRQIKLTDHMINKIKPILAFIDLCLEYDKKESIISKNTRLELLNTCVITKEYMDDVSEKSKALIASQNDDNYQVYINSLISLKENVMPLQLKTLEMVSQIIN